jgi:hypothetical protein
MKRSGLALGFVTRKVVRIPRGRGGEISRAEFNALITQLNARGELLEKILHDLEIQFQRIAELQAEVDELRRGFPPKPSRR